MLSFVLVICSLTLFAFVISVRAKRRDDKAEFRGIHAIDVEIGRELARRGED